MSDEIDQGRRRFLGTAAMSVAAAKLGVLPSVDARSNAAGPTPSTPLDATKRIDAGSLSVGYAEAGPSGGPAVILLHGWPYDIQSFAEVVPILASAGYRVIVPYLRGYGSTRFRSGEAFRNGQPSALAVDVIDLMDALEIKSATLAGFDWGARSADIVAALWPERCKALVSVSGYLIGSQQAGKIPLPPRPSSSGGTSSTLRPSAAATATTRTGTTLRSSSGSSRHRSGTSTTPRSTAAPCPSTTPITSRS